MTDWIAHPGSSLVHGTVNEYLVVIPRTQAEELAGLNAAVAACRTWVELKARVPPATWAGIVEALDEEPDLANEFDGLPGYGDGDWPDWPAQRALEWLPEDVQPASSATWSAHRPGARA